MLQAEVEQEVDAQAAEFAMELPTGVAPEFVEVYQDTVSVGGCVGHISWLSVWSGSKYLRMFFDHSN